MNFHLSDANPAAAFTHLDVCIVVHVSGCDAHPFYANQPKVTLQEVSVGLNHHQKMMIKSILFPDKQTHLGFLTSKDLIKSIA